MAAIEATHDTGGALAVYSGQKAWTPEQRAALAQIGVANASDADLTVFLHYAQRTGLDPFSRQIYMIERWQDGGKKQTIQTGIDGFRLIAHRTGKYRGRKAIEWCGDDGVWHDVWLGGKSNPPRAAKVTVLRADYDAPVSHVVMYDEYVARNRQGEITKMWQDKPALMLAKCGEAGALRAAFPNDLSGLYTDDEMMHVDGPAEGPAFPDSIDGETATPPNMGRPQDKPPVDWQALIDERVAVQEQDPAAAAAGLKSLLDQARGMIPNDGATLNKIAQAWGAAKAAAADGGEPPKSTSKSAPSDPSKPNPATAAQKGKIATLIGKAGVTGFAARHIVAATLAGIDPLLMSFDDLDRKAAGVALDKLIEWEKESVERLTSEVAEIMPADDDPVWDTYAVAKAEHDAANEDGR